MQKVYFEDFHEGAEFSRDEVTVEREEMLAHNRQNDPLPIHVDEEAAKLTRYGDEGGPSGSAIRNQSQATASRLTG